MTHGHDHGSRRTHTVLTALCGVALVLGLLVGVPFVPRSVSGVGVAAASPPGCIVTATVTDTRTNVTSNFPTTGTFPAGFTCQDDLNGAFTVEIAWDPSMCATGTSPTCDLYGYSWNTENLTPNQPDQPYNGGAECNFGGGTGTPVSQGQGPATELSYGDSCVVQKDPNVRVPGFHLLVYGNTSAGAYEVYNFYYADGATGPPPTAAINYFPTGTVANQWVFDGSPSIAGTGSSITKYAWNFGDGTTATGETVDHQFTSEGDRTVSLTVTDADGQTGTASTTISPALKVTTVSFSPAAIDANSEFTVSETVTNEGTTTVTGVAPTATVADPTIASVVATPTPAGADIAPGLSQTYTFGASATKAGATSVNLGAAGSVGATPVTAPTVLKSLTVGSASLAITLVADPGTVAAGSPTTVTATITNTTSDTLSGLTPALQSNPSAGLTIGSPTTTNTGTLDPHGTTTVAWPVTTIDPGTFSLTVSAQVVDPNTGSETDTGTAQLTVVPSTLVVTTTGDQALTTAQLATGICDVDPNTAGNQCTLRAAIQLANSLGGSQSITFDIPGGGVPVIAPTSALPELQTSTIIDGTTQPGGWIQLSGASEGGTAPGLTVGAGAAVIRGLVIDGWANFGGVFVSGGSGTVIAGNRIGTDPTGTTAVPNGYGVYVQAPNVTVGGTNGTSLSSCTGDCNLLSGNDDGTGGGEDSGVYIAPGGSATVVGNYIGTDVTGEHAVGNAYGVYDASTGGTTTSVIGGPTSVTGAAPGNLISGNRINGVEAFGGIDTVQGNLIGEDRSGSVSLQPAAALNPPSEPGGSGVGIGVSAGSDSVVTVGGTSQADRNVIGGFGNVGVFGATTVENDEVGTNPAGTAAIANGDGTNTVGSVTDSLISGNSGIGLDVTQTVTGDRIGTSADGQSALPNAVGVVSAGQVGGDRPAGSTACTGPCNLISGNLGPAVSLAQTVVGNFIGTNLSGTAAIPNGTTGPQGEAVSGVAELGGSSGAVARGVCDQACNLISGNNGIGVEFGATSGGTSVQGNLIGTDINLGPLGNQGPGVFSLVGSGGQDLVGGGGDLGNIIAHNGGAAVEVGFQSVLPTVEGNAMIGNAGGGILVDQGFSGTVPASPTIATAVSSPGQLAVTGNVTDLVTSGNRFISRIDLYASASCTSGPQGQVPLGDVTIGPITDGSFTMTTAAVARSLPYVVATSTESGATSPFSSCFPISTASATSLQAGQQVTVQAPGFTPGEQVSVTLHSTPVHLETVTADAGGQVTTTVTIPSGTVPGAHELILTGLTSGTVVTIPITVTAVAGYDLVGGDGGVFSLGNNSFFGSAARAHLNRPVVGMAATPDGGGYWLVAADGGVFSYGDAGFYGSTGGTRLAAPVVGMAATPDGGGYWLVAADGGVFSYGDASFHGSAGGTHLNSPVVGMAATPDGGGYWLVAADGGVFAYGDAGFFGSMGGTHLDSPVVGMSSTPDGKGYRLVAADGGVFAFGDAGFFGSMGGTHLDSPVMGMSSTSDGNGYWLTGADGGVFSFGDAAFGGSVAGTPLAAPVVGIAGPT